MPSCRYTRRHSALVHLSRVFSALLLPAVFSIFSVEFVFILCRSASAANPASPHLSHQPLIRSEENENFKKDDTHKQTFFFFSPPACKSSFMSDWLQYNNWQHDHRTCVCVCAPVSCAALTCAGIVGVSCWKSTATNSPADEISRHLATGEETLTLIKHKVDVACKIFLNLNSTKTTGISVVSPLCGWLKTAWGRLTYFVLNPESNRICVVVCTPPWFWIPGNPKWPEGEFKYTLYITLKVHLLTVLAICFSTCECARVVNMFSCVFSCLFLKDKFTHKMEIVAIICRWKLRVNVIIHKVFWSFTTNGAASFSLNDEEKTLN